MTLAIPALAVVRRELLTSLRGKRSAAMLWILLGITTFIIWYFWSEFSRNALDIRNALETANGLVMLAVAALYIGVALFVPAFAANSIALERDRATFDLLKLSLARPAGIVLAKLASAVGVAILMMIALAPLAAVSQFVAGVDARIIVGALLMVIAAAVSCASAGLLSSALFRRNIIAIFGAYAGVIAICLFPIAAYAALSIASWFLGVAVLPDLDDFLLKYSPPGALIWLISGGLTSVSFSLVPSLLYQAGFSLFCLLWTQRLVARPPKPPKIEQEKPIDDKKALRDRRLGWPFYLIDPLRRKKVIGDRRNPMFVRELRWGLFNRGTILVRIFYVSFVVYMISGVFASWDARSYSTMNAWFMIQIWGTIFITPALAANAMTKEIELGNLDMLRMTLLRPYQIVIGKLAAALFSIGPILSASVLSALPVVLTANPNWTVLGMGYATLVICTLLTLAITLTCSMIARRTTTALVAGYVVSFVACIGLGIIAKQIHDFDLLQDALVSYLHSPGRFEYSHYPDLGDFASPIFMLNWALSTLDNEAWIVLPVWGPVMAAWAALAALLVAGGVAYFALYRMRDR